MPTLTTILALQKPIVGDDNNLWGGQLNGNLDTLGLLGALTVTTPSASATLAFGTFPIAGAFATGGAGGTALLAP